MRLVHAYQTHAAHVAVLATCLLTHAIPAGRCDCDGCRGPVLCSPRGPSFVRLCKVGFYHGAVLHETRRPNFTNRFCDCCNVGTGHALRSELRGPIFTRWSCEFGFCRGPVLCNPMMPNFTNRFCDCCNVGAVFFKSRRRSFTSKLYDCCNVGTGRAPLLWTRKTQLHQSTLRV